MKMFLEEGLSMAVMKGEGNMIIGAATTLLEGGKQEWNVMVTIEAAKE